MCFANYVLFLFFAVVTGEIIKVENSKPRVCVVGAGVAGLSSARYLQEADIPFTVFEATRYVGGTWRYDPRVGTDENGLPLYTSMYKHLRTNLPKQAMEFHGFPVPEDMPSFPSWKLYYEYIQSYAKHFNLTKNIQFLHKVVSIKREDSHWRVKHRHVVSGDEFDEIFDYIFICTGHYSKPNHPKIPNEDKFKGTIIHSHDYREPDPYKGRRVLTIGSGPSGMDITLDIAEVSLRAVHSHHSVVTFRTPFPDNYIYKPDVKEFTENGVIFTDGTYEEIDDVIYCTGFQYTYPFLDESSGLTLTPRYILPLYKYLVNIPQPTMLLFGLVVRACIVAAIDAQARYATALVLGNFTLPSQEDMMKEWQIRHDLLKSKGRPLSDLHLLSDKEDQYYGELAAESGTIRVPPVLFKIRNIDTMAKLENLYTYRNYVYTIIDDNNFTRSWSSS